MKLPNPVCITGCGKSGTHYITDVLYRGGVEIGHERYKPDGMSSWYITSAGLNVSIPSNVKWFVKLKDFEKKPIILQQVRNPLKAISTFQMISAMSWRLIQCIPEINEHDSLILKCMKYWKYWNLMAEKLAEWTYRIENIGNVWEEFCNRINCPELIQKKAECLSVEAKKSQAGKYKSLSWEDLEKANGKLCKGIIKQGIRYGYSI